MGSPRTTDSPPWPEPINRSRNPQTLFYLHGTTSLIGAASRAVGHVAAVIRFCALGSGGGSCSTNSKWWKKDNAARSYTPVPNISTPVSNFQPTGYGGSLPKLKFYLRRISIDLIILVDIKLVFPSVEALSAVASSGQLAA